MRAKLHGRTRIPGWPMAKQHSKRMALADMVAHAHTTEVGQAMGRHAHPLPESAPGAAAAQRAQQAHDRQQVAVDVLRAMAQKALELLLGFPVHLQVPFCLCLAEAHCTQQTILQSLLCQPMTNGKFLRCSISGPFSRAFRCTCQCISASALRELSLSRNSSSVALNGQYVPHDKLHVVMQGPENISSACLRVSRCVLAQASKKPTAY